NGQEVYKFTGVRPLAVLDPTRPVLLHKGTNVLVVKVVNGYLDWEGCARFVDQEGKPAKGLRISLAPEPSGKRSRAEVFCIAPTRASWNEQALWRALGQRRPSLLSTTTCSTKVGLPAWGGTERRLLALRRPA